MQILITDMHCLSSLVLSVCVDFFFNKLSFSPIFQYLKLYLFFRLKLNSFLCKIGRKVCQTKILVETKPIIISLVFHIQSSIRSWAFIHWLYELLWCFFILFYLLNRQCILNCIIVSVVFFPLIRKTINWLFLVV